MQWPATPDLGPGLSGTATRASYMPAVVEETSHPGHTAPQEGLIPPTENARMLRRASAAALSALGLNRTSTIDSNTTAPAGPDHEYDLEIVDLLDVVGV
jgi:hypothetical protein